MTHIQLSLTSVHNFTVALQAIVTRDISSVAPDLIPPEMTDGEPAPGKRVRAVMPEYRETEVYHALYLPTDWQPDNRYPVIVEYTGNGGYKSEYEDVCTGKVEDSKLGYGISGGKGFIWVCMPYLNSAGDANVELWWGDKPKYDPGPTLDYCRKTVPHICANYGGDPDAVILTGFSRGAIACNCLGLSDDDIARLWLAFIPFSCYDGTRKTPDSASAPERLKRLNGRSQFICEENSQSLEDTKQYIKSTGVQAPFTFMHTGFRNHNDAWTLRPSPARTAMREWLDQVIRNRA